MTARKMLGVSLALLFAASTLSALQSKPVDLTGTWTGTLTRSTGQAGPAHIVLKQKDAEVTGTAGPGPDNQTAIPMGKVATLKVDLEEKPVAMEPGLRFAIREGGRTVGSGVVTKILT